MNESSSLAEIEHLNRLISAENQRHDVLQRLRCSERDYIATLMRIEYVCKHKEKKEREKERERRKLIFFFHLYFENCRFCIALAKTKWQRRTRMHC
jgi:hypothetical protein